MALKVLMLRKELDDTKKALEELRSKKNFEQREADLEKSIEEASTDEEKAAVNEAIDTLEKDKTEFGEEEQRLEGMIEDIEKKIEEEEKPQEDRAKKVKKQEREGVKTMGEVRFFNMSYEERERFFADEDVKGFLERVRDIKSQQRAVTGAELLIPVVVLDLIKENIAEFSKLYKHVNVKPVSGTARQNVMGIIPEAVWTEMCAKINEIDISFGGVEVDGYKVGGFVAVCNALLEDSDIALASEIITALGKAIGLALDKAILYGTGTKMPVGIVTRLVQTEDPQNPKNTIPWTDLHISNVLSITGKTDLALFKSIVESSGAAKGTYSRGGKFWAMSSTTHTKLMANALSVNAAGAIVSGENGTMPVIGGAIEELDFIPDNVIIGGYGDLYLLAERAGASIKQSEEVKFLDDQTVFKGTARYDGLPVIANGFVAMNIAGGTVSTSGVTFAPDVANTTQSSEEESPEVQE